MSQDWKHLQDIEGETSSFLDGKLVGLAICGSIAAIEVYRLSRLLIRNGAKVQAFMTQAASDLVSVSALEWCTGRPVIKNLTSRCEHLEYFGENGKAELLLVAPMTANTCSKVALGLDDNLVTTCVTTALGAGVKVMCAPGMHEPMVRHPAVAKNLSTLESYGIEILAPVAAEGKLKMMPCEEIVAKVLRALGPGDLSGRTVLLTGGPTREFLDPARCLTNPSSGLSACLLSEEAFRRGADVHLIYGPGTSVPARWIQTEPVISTQDMENALLRYLRMREPDFFLGVAAVCDYRPTQPLLDKRPTSLGGFQLDLQVTPKLLDLVRRESPSTKLISFKALPGKDDRLLEEAAAAYLRDDRADLVVANFIGQQGLGFEQPDNRYLVVSKSNPVVTLGPASKRRLSHLLWDQINGNVHTSDT